MSTTPPRPTPPDVPAEAGPATEGALALRAALLRSAAVAAGACVLAALLTAVVAFWVVGVAGVWGALIGYAVALGFLVTTALVGARTAGGDPLRVATVVLGSWLVKVVLVGGVLVALRDMTFYDPGSLVVGLIVGMVITLFVEYRTVTAAHIPYVDTSGR